MSVIQRILLIDDEDVITFGFSMVLAGPTVIVDCASTLAEGMAFIQKHSYAAAVIDLRLSNSEAMEGYDLIQLMRLCQPSCAIIALTAYGDPQIRKHAEVLGANLFFEKPVEPEIIKNELFKMGIAL